MFGGETVRAMVSECLRGRENLLATLFASEALIKRDEIFAGGLQFTVLVSSVTEESHLASAFYLTG